MPAAPEQLASAYVAAWNDHDAARIEAMHAASFEGIDVGDTRTTRGRAEVREATERYFRAFPDLQLTIQRTVAHGEHVALFWTAQGTHRGPLLHIPPTGRVVAVQGSSLLTIHDQQIASGVCIWDVAGMLRALGLLPEL